ncbi:MAG: Gfo/Idh/MocA family oxidoreductase [Trueperaceae bacterium]
MTRTAPSRLRAGIVGTGGISQLHLDGYRTAGADVVAICDVDPGTLAARAAAWKVPATYTDAERMFADADLDVVSIATPVTTHHPLVLAAARAGVHVLCEKPIALDLRHAREMIEACERADVRLQIGHQLRSDGAVAQARRAIDAGTIGEVAFVRLRQAHDWGGATAVRPSFATRASGGAGTLLDNGCHMMDLARFFAGDAEEVYARVATRRWPIELEDTAQVSIRFASGALGSVEAAWTATGWEEAFWIYGSHGSLEWSNRHQEPVLRHAFRDSPGTTWSETDVSTTAFAGERAHTRQIRAFLAAARGEGEVACSGEDGLEAVRLVLAAYDAAGRNRPVRLGDEADTLHEAYERIAAL